MAGRRRRAYGRQNRGGGQEADTSLLPAAPLHTHDASHFTLRRDVATPFATPQPPTADSTRCSAPPYAACCHYRAGVRARRAPRIYRGRFASTTTLAVTRCGKPRASFRCGTMVTFGAPPFRAGIRDTSNAISLKRGCRRCHALWYAAGGWEGMPLC